jgi:hypothetical protein
MLENGTETCVCWKIRGPRMWSSKLQGIVKQFFLKEIGLAKFGETDNGEIPVSYGGINLRFYFPQMGDMSHEIKKNR